MKKKIPVIYHLLVRPTLLLAIVTGLLLWWLLPADWLASTRMLVSWDSAIAVYIIVVLYLMFHSGPEQIHHRAARQDEGQKIFLMLATLAPIASLAIIMLELTHAKDMDGVTKFLHIGLAGLTVFLSWVFMQIIFAIHYAHEYYMTAKDMANDSALVRFTKKLTGKKKFGSGLQFPGHPQMPDYWDFAYFSFIIGTAAQTADVNITSATIRRTVMLHCIIIFFFNTTILALTINIAAGLFAG